MADFSADNMEQKEYMVLGIKDFPEKDTETEKDNPYIFNSLVRAIQVAEGIAKDDYYSHARVVEIISVVIFGGADFVSKDKKQDWNMPGSIQDFIDIGNTEDD